MKKYSVVLLLFVLSAACSFKFGLRENATADSNVNANAELENKNKQAAVNLQNRNAGAIKQPTNSLGGQSANAQTKADCLKNRRGEKVPDAKQTFVLDFEPFQGDCFITFHDPQYTDPPLDSEFHLYRNGKAVFEFPEQLHGGTCWIDAVSFVDLNRDQLKDIIIVGMCGAKAGPYNENLVYANTGEGFKTNEDANYKLNDFKKIREIENFVRRNQKLFFK
jgi:hypothetical protein